MKRVPTIFLSICILAGCYSEEPNEVNLQKPADQIEFGNTFRLGGDELMAQFEEALKSNNIEYRTNPDGTISYHERDSEQVQVVLDAVFLKYLEARKGRRE
ncbi:hypothetical protein [Microbulbifer hainanensis]|uniref:hypothetical protein n=1 Tax=Microbulbifer hainanensis TaxID=2735675 RepID=UPI0018686733|nr:hypothetical protein [Microbulbifer hainanensis]